MSSNFLNETDIKELLLLTQNALVEISSMQPFSRGEEIAISNKKDNYLLLKNKLLKLSKSKKVYFFERNTLCVGGE